MMGGIRDMVYVLQSKCQRAIDGELDGEEQRALASQAIGAFGGMPIVGPNVKRACNVRDWNMLYGAIGMAAGIEPSGNGVSVVQNANPVMTQTQSVSTSVSLSNVIELISEDDLDDEDLAKLKALLLDCEASKGSESKLRRVGREIADIAFDKASSSIPSLLGYLASLFSM